MSQSSRFLNEPGSAPAYSGVEKSTASAACTAARSSATAGGSGSRSSSWLKWGSEPRPSYNLVETWSGATSRTVRSTAELVDRARRLPEIRRTRTTRSEDERGLPGEEARPLDGAGRRVLAPSETAEEPGGVVRYEVVVDLREVVTSLAR